MTVARVRSLQAASGERGFTLLEIMIAMAILAAGSIGIISLFAAAVAMQFESTVNRDKAGILSDVVHEAQETLDRHVATPEQPLPSEIERRVAERSADFEYAVEFHAPPALPKGEGALAEITLWYRGVELEDRVKRLLARTRFSKKELEVSISLERDRRADEMEKTREDRE